MTLIIEAMVYRGNLHSWDMTSSREWARMGDWYTVRELEAEH